MEQLTGPQLFLRYALPCAEEKLRNGRINQNSLDVLMATAKNNDLPNNFSLGYCFPNAAISLYKFAQKNNKEMWAFETVAEYWRHHHQSNTPVIHAMITEITENKIMALYDGRGFEVSNPYQLSLEPFSVVSVHCEWIIEVIA